MKVEYSQPMGKHKIMGWQRQNRLSRAKESVIQRSRDSYFCCI